MTPQMVLTIGHDALTLLLMISMPVLGIVMAVGLVVSIFQAATQINEATSFIVATETGILHQMQQESPNKTFIPAPPNNNCACNDCPHMKLNTLEKIYLCMEYELPEITMDESLRLAAKKPMDRMLEISKEAGLIG